MARAEAAMKLPPRNEEAEVSVLGAMMISERAVPRVLEIIRVPDYFYLDRHRVIYEAMRDLFQQSHRIDLITLSDALRKNSKLALGGGAVYLSTLANSVPSAANVEEYARIVKEKYLLRQMIDVSVDMANACYSDQQSPDEVMDKAQSRICGLASVGAAGSYMPVGDILDETIDELENICKHKGLTTGVASGYRRFDEMTMGLHPAELIIIAARPSMGKTAFALNIAMNAAREKKDRPILIFSLEMSAPSLLKRLLCSEAKVNLHNLSRGVASAHDWARLMEAASSMKTMPVFIDDSALVTPLEIAAKARRLKQERGLGLIIIDYLQLMTSGGRNESRVQEISAITRNLKALARELKVPLIALSQLSRQVEQRENKRPQLADLRESGSIEQDADLVVFLYRAEYYKKEQADPEEIGRAELIIGKQRNGPVGSLPLVFLKDFTRFENLSQEEEAGMYSEREL